MRNVRSLVLVSFVLACWAPLSVAQEAERIVTDPPLLSAVRTKAQTLMAMEADDANGAAGETALDLNIVYTDGKLWNPATRVYDKVRLRSYQGTDVNPRIPFISPRIEVAPGDTIRITLNNKLPVDSSCTSSGGDVNVPHCFNGTNLHTHGMWVNPAGNGDNVLISINPGVSFQYEYKIPPDHPAGTFWYHTHRHGSTALQVSSGMAGALIVRGDRPPQRGNDGKIRSGDLDTLLKATPSQRFRERIVVLQQIQYSCRDASGNIEKNPDGTYLCNAGDVGGIESYDEFRGSFWQKSGRYTSINGQVLPTFKGAKAGQIERWRVIHGGIRDTIALQFRAMKADAPVTSPLAAADNDAFVGANCTGSPLLQHVVASDGLTLAAALKKTTLTFQPGYRWDTLVVFPKPGIYCVIDDASPATANVNANAPSRSLLGFVRVAEGGTVPSADLTAYVTSQLAAAAHLHMPNDVRAKVEADIKDGLKFSSFIAHADIPEAELTGPGQTLVFSMDESVNPTIMEVNGEPFDPSRLDRQLILGQAEEWTLSSGNSGHPYHIHVNPFQIVKILDPTGKDVSAPDATEADGDTQYPGLKGQWKDTLWIKNGAKDASGTYTIVVRTRYQRYIGSFVLHCHILDHEDKGMMQNVNITLPESGHHH